MKNKKQQIEDAAKSLASERGAINITRQDVCDRAGVPDGAFTAIMDENFTEFMSRLDLPTGGVAHRKRAIPALRRKHVLDVAIELSKTQGYNTVTRTDVAAAAGVSPGLVSHYYRGISHLRQAILRAAVSRGVLEIVAQGLVHGDPIAIRAPKELKYKAVAHLAEL